MSTEKANKIQHIYDTMLRTDVMEFEKDTELDRLHRIDRLLFKAAEDKLKEGHDVVEVCNNFVEFIQIMDSKLEGKGAPQFSSNERLQNALAFFKQEPKEFLDYINDYKEVRESVWADVLGSG